MRRGTRTVRLSRDEENRLRDFADRKHIGIGTALRMLAFTKLEELET